MTAIELDWATPDVALIRLARPERLNALTHEMLDELIDALAVAAGTPGARAIVLTGAGRGFCAGVDIAGSHERSQGQGRSPAIRYWNQEHFAATMRAIRECRLPVVAAINGPVAGAGLAMALTCDVRLAAPTARFLIGAPRLALSAGECGISWLLPRIIGAGRAAEIMLTNREISVDEALATGLVTSVSDAGSLVPDAQATAARIAANSPFGVAMTKKLFWSALDQDYRSAVEVENRTQILATLTDDSAEGRIAFLERRSPQWQGR